MDKSEIAQSCYDAVQKLLGPTCAEHGLSFKAMPADSKTEVVRTAMAYLFVEGWTLDSPRVAWASRHVTMATIQAYVLILASSQVGPRSATWAAELILAALDKPAKGTAVYANGYKFSSFKDSVWQYRIPLDIRLPVSTANYEVEQDL